MSLLKLENVFYCYDPDKQIKVLNNISYEFEKGKIYANRKVRFRQDHTPLTAFRTCLSYRGKDTFQRQGHHRDRSMRIRSQMVGVIFQGYNLLLHYNAVDNVICLWTYPESILKTKKMLP